ncbi:hypothetical protein [Chthonobacter albigriseus]|uniref:hypothetical protein n=1 Tax=Chthonobacter albigriseus TaxID=1683161 RepID=UPI0015EF67D7|nr:hypothetical protein [Chthonobacter albigriseus]
MRARLYAAALLAIAATLGVKISTGGTPSVPERAESAARLDAFLKTAGFEPFPLPDKVPLGIEAWRGEGCDMLAGVINLVGAEDRLVQKIVPPGWSATYVFDGATHTTAPKMAATTRDYLNRARWIFDESIGFEPILVTIHQPGCDIAGLPWSEMGRAAYRRGGFAG